MGRVFHGPTCPGTVKGTNRNWCLGKDMCHLADSTAELLQVGENRYVGW